MYARRRSLSRGAAWALLWLGLLLLHLALLQLLWPMPSAPGVAGTVVLQIRTIAVAPPPPVAAMPAAPAPPARPRPVARAHAVAPAQPAIDAPPAGPAPAADTPWPLYATRLPAAAELHYRVKRGDSVGRARLLWAPGDGGYELRLDTVWPGQAVRGAASRGLIDADGVAPLRHTELQRARETRAVNFQRETGRITFSGPQLAYALRPGAQDRLSWLIQLPAIVEADAALARPGATVQIFVAGTRGDAEVWHFEVQGIRALELPAVGVAQALHLRREPTRPYDSRIEVWLDPERQHLPVRVVFTTLPGGVPLEMALAGTTAAGNGLETEEAGPR